MIKGIFFNPIEQRLRAGWRLLMQLVLGLLLILIFGLVRSSIGLSDKFSSIFTQGVALLCSVWLASASLDKRPFSSLGLRFNRRWLVDFGAGSLIALLGISLVFLAHWQLDWIAFLGMGWDRAGSFWLPFGSYLLSMLAVGFYEEIFSRGYQMKNFFEGFFPGKGSPVLAITLTVLASSIFFAVLHGANPNITFLALCNLVLAGLMLALPYLLTGSLGLSVGIHWSWNFFMGGFFGFPVSGQPFRESLFQIELLRSDWITGGDFGPEGGLTGILAIVFMAMLTLAYIRVQYTNISFHESFVADAKHFQLPNEIQNGASAST